MKNRLCAALFVLLLFGLTHRLDAQPSISVDPGSPATNKIVLSNSYAGADMSAQIANAKLALDPTNGGIIDARGYTTTQSWGTTVNIDRPVYLLLPCQIMNVTAELFSFTGTKKFTVEGCGPRSSVFAANGLSGTILVEMGNRTVFRDFEIQMGFNNAGDLSKNAIDMDAGAAVRQNEIHDIWVLYAGGATGDGVLVNDTSGIIIEDCFINAAGIGLHLKGDNRTNGDVYNTLINASTGYSVKWERTTATDNGGMFFANVSTSLTPASGSGGWLFTSTAANTEFPSQLINIVSDGVTGRPSFELVNAKDVYFGNDWITSTDSPAIQITAGGQISVVGGTLQGTYGLNFIGSSSTITSVSAIGMFVNGSTASFNNNAAVTNFNYLDQAQLNLNGTISLGSNTVFRCATAGALPAGALTITAGSCGTTTDSGLRIR